MIRFVAFTDLHYDHIPDGDRRLEELISNMGEEKIDFIISLGDLCYPSIENRKVIHILNNSGVPVYYAIGNHDSDLFMQDDVMKFYNIREDYYSFVIEETKFIVLNSCYIKGKDSSYPYYKRNYNKSNDIYPFIPDVEQEWLIKEMQSQELNYVIFSHHSLANDFMKRGIANRKEIREIFSYTDEIHKRYPFLKDLILYKEPLYAIIEINNEKISVKGRSGHYQTITPQDVGIGTLWN